MTEEMKISCSWYIVHTYSGQEDSVKNHIEQTVDNIGLQEKIQRVLIPTEEVIEIRKNKRQIRKRKFFPGYVLIQMAIDNETYWLVRNTAGVTGFLGGAKPTPLPEEEVRVILEVVEAQPQSKPRPAVVFEKGESVRINDGPFRHFIGLVEEVNMERAKLKVMVTIFGRPTPVELDFLQVEKL